MDSSKLNRLLALQKQLVNSPAMRAAEQLANSPAMRAAEQLANSPAMRAAEQAAEQHHRMADEAARLLESPAMRAAEQAAAEQYHRMADQATVYSPLLEQFEQAYQTASKLLAETPQLTPELFGGAWNDSVAEAVRRLERTEVAEHHDGVADEDVATVQEAAPPEAQARVKARLCWLRVCRGLARLEKIIARLVLICTLLGKPIPDVFTTAQLLGVTAPPSGPPVPAPNSSTTQGIIEPVTTALTLPGTWAVEGLPAIVVRAGPTAAERVVEFFTTQIRSNNTRAAYAKAVTQFFTWCDERGLELDEVSPVAVAAYVEELQGEYRAPTIKQHLALPVPRNFSLDFLKPPRYGGGHGDSESSWAQPAG